MYDIRNLYVPLAGFNCISFLGLIWLDFVSYALLGVFFSFSFSLYPLSLSRSELHHLSCILRSSLYYRFTIEGEGISL